MLIPAIKWKFVAILLFCTLLVIAFREKYPQRIKDAIYKPAMNGQSDGTSFQSNVFYREQIDYQTLFTSQRNVVMLGNSLTFRMHWDELLDRTDVANRGIGSDVIKGFYHRLDKVIELDPKICFIEGGANDIEFGIDLDTSFHYLNIIIDSLSGAGIVPVVSCVIYVTKDYPGSTRFNLNAKAFNQKLNQFSQENMIDVIDLNPVIAPRGYLELEFAQSDGIHLTSNAYTIWKQMIQNKLRKYKI